MKSGLVRVVILALLAAGVPMASALADTHWTGAVSNDWADAGNWDNGVPAAGAGNGNAIVNPGGANGDPVVSTAGNTTDIGVYISINGVGMTIASGGELNITDTFVTGVWGDSGLVTTAGTLTIGGYLNIGAGAFDGDLLITGGTVSAANLSINTTNGASIDMTGGQLIFPSSNLGNVNYWIEHSNITAFSGAGTINVDETTSPGYIILTPVGGGGGEENVPVAGTAGIGILLASMMFGARKALRKSGR